MDRDWENKFKKWAQPPSQTEENRCQNAINVIRNALSSYMPLNEKPYSVILQGSYANNTNVRTESDIDIGIVYTGAFIYNNLPFIRVDQNFPDSPYLYNDFRQDVYKALINYLGSGAVSKSNKTLNIKETTYHVDADATPFFEYRLYYDSRNFYQGVALLTQRDQKIVANFPYQHLMNGREKNNFTFRYYKKMVRVLKALTIERMNIKFQSNFICGFLIECLLYNLPDNCFGLDTYTQSLQSILETIYAYINDNSYKNFLEVNGIKLLFNNEQKWNVNDVKKFVESTWNYCGF